MFSYDSPGVYINERESGARPIEASGTSTAAFLGYARTGEAGNAVPIESFKEYTEAFGEISENGNSESDSLAFTAQAYFQNGGRQAYIINVSKGGDYSNRELYAGRKAPVELFTVKAKGVGSHADDLEVWLIPEDGPSSGIFSFRVMRRVEYGLKEEENYRRVDLAPGLPGSLEQVVNDNSKLVNIELASGIEKKVFPSIPDTVSVKFGKTQIIAINDAMGIKLKLLDQYITNSLEFNGLDENDPDSAAVTFQHELNEKTKNSDAPYGLQFECKVIANELCCMLKSTHPEASFEFLNGAGTVLNEQKTPARKDLLAKLITGKESGDLQQAVLSSEINIFDATLLSAKNLDVQIGNEFGRSVVITRMSQRSSLEYIAYDIQQQLRTKQLSLPITILPSVIQKGSYCQIAFGPDVLPGSHLMTNDGKSGDSWLEAQAEEMVWHTPQIATDTELEDLKADFDNSLTLRILANDVEEVSITIGIGGVENIAELTEAIQSGIANLKAEPSPTIIVEAIGNRLLLWDAGDTNTLPKDIAVLASPAGDLLNLTKSRGAFTNALNLLQGGLPIGGRLQGGKNGKKGGVDGYEEALQLLETYPDVSIICLPGHQWGDDGHSRQIIEKTINHARRLGDRMVIVDPPKPTGTGKLWSTENDVRMANLPTSSYSALYYPWVHVPAPRMEYRGNGSSNQVLVPPCGFVAGVWSVTDKERGVWKAPAGVDARLQGVLSLQHDLTNIQGGALNRYGVNVLRNLPGYGGAVVWGGRTLATKTEPQWKYLPVRRTALMIEDSLRENMLWAVHQPNRSELWAALRLNIDAFMNRLFRAGAFQPDAASKAYFVKCGLGSTMSQADIDAGVVRVRVGFAPVKPAEFVVIDIEQITENN